MFDSNRRKYPRANYPCHLTMWPQEGRNEAILAQTSNVGCGGVCVHINEEIVVGRKIDIQIDFTRQTIPFRCKGTVVRCQRDGDRFYNLGIEFEHLSELKSAFIEEKVSELISLEKKGKI